MFKYPWKCPGISLGGVLPWWKASGKVWGSLIIYIAPFHVFLQCAKSFNGFNNVWVINYFSISQLLRKIAWARVSCSQHSAVATSPQHAPCPWHKQTESTCENDDFTSEQAVISTGIKPVTSSFLSDAGRAPEVQNMKHSPEIKYHLNALFMA